MKLQFLKAQRVRSAFASAFLLVALFANNSFAQTAATAATQQQSATLSAAEQELAARVNVETIKQITKDLSAPEMQGRGTLQPGGERAANYIADRFQKLGLKPLGDKNTFLQKIDFKERAFTGETAMKINGESLKMGSDYAVMPYYSGNEDAGGEPIFIAYGLQARSIKRDDLAGVSLNGKIVVMLEGPPANVSEADWKQAKAAQSIFMNLVQQGVAGIIFVSHGREKQGFDEMKDYFVRRQILLPNEKGLPDFVPPLVQISNDAAEKLFAGSGVAFKDALAAAERSDFKPVKLKQTVKITAKYKQTNGAANNVVGLLEGADPNLKAEAVVFSAHYDAYGMENGKIFPGAADNALGVAEMIAVAEAISKGAQKPRRSLIFLAVTAEEYGLYGSKFWAKNPTWKIKSVAADLNLDGIGTEVYAPVKTFVGFGAEHSTLGADLNSISSALGINVIPDPMPDEKIFYRSDHYSFVEKGVPSLMLLGAPAGDPQVWIKRSKDWEKTDYHREGDVIKPDWAWEGAQTVAIVMALMSHRVANSDKMPEWLPSSRFAKLERGNTKDVPEEDQPQK